MGFGRRMAIAFFARSKNFFAIGGAAQFRPVQRPAAEAALSAATVGKPYKMCGLGLSELQLAIRSLGSDSSREARGMPLRVRRRTEERRFSKSRIFFRRRRSRRDLAIRGRTIRRLQSDAETGASFANCDSRNARRGLIAVARRRACAGHRARRTPRRPCQAFRFCFAGLFAAHQARMPSKAATTEA